MMTQKTFFLFLIPMVVLVGCQSPGDSETSESGEFASSEWEILFDGKSVDQWRGYNLKSFPDVGWHVENGELVVEKSGTEEEGNGGDIITKNKYRDFEFELDYILSDTSNSGIFYMVQELDDTPIWHHAPEYQIIDNPTYEATEGVEWMNTHRTADNYDLQMADQDYSKPVEEWNHARIVKQGNHVEHWLNGNKTIEYEINSSEWKVLVAKSKFKDFPNFCQAEEGHIGLQDHGHRVAFKNIRVKVL